MKRDNLYAEQGQIGPQLGAARSNSVYAGCADGLAA